MWNKLVADIDTRMVEVQMERDAAKRVSVKVVKGGDKHEDAGLKELESDDAAAEDEDEGLSDLEGDEDEDEAEGSVWSGEGGIFLRVTGWRTARTRSSTSKKKWSMRPWI